MDTVTESLTDRITRLENQSRRLRRAVFVVWPVVWIISVITVFTMTKLDAGTIRPFLNWLGAVIFILGFATFAVLSFLFVIKVASDYRNRKSQFTLNPRSKKP